MIKKILLLFFFLFLFFLLPAQKGLNNFIVYSDQKIPSRVNFRIFEDSRGYIWIGSKNGLYKFDGFQSESFFSNFDDSTTLTSNAISDIEEDADGFLWISTASNGLVRMDPFTGKMKQYPSPTPSDNPVYPVWDIFKDENNVLWFGSGGRGIVRYFPETDSFVNYIVDPQKISDGSVRFDNEIKEITADPFDKNILWAAGMHGLFRFNKTTGVIEKFQFSINGKKSWRDNSFHCIYIQDLQNIWLGSWAGGLVKFDYVSKKFRHFLINENAYKQNDMSQNIILDILKGPMQQLYICSADAGFLAFEESTEKFTIQIDAQKIPNKELFTNSASRFKNGSLWIAGEGFIIQHHPLFNRFQQVTDLTPLAEKGLPSPAFINAVYDKPRNKYIVSLGGNHGLIELNDDLSISDRIPCSITIPTRTISNIFFDNKGILYAASSSPPYLMFLDKSKKMLRPVAGNLIDLKRFPETMIIRSAVFDGNKNIWIACNNNQLIKWDTENNTTKKYIVTVNKQSGLPDNVFILQIAIDSLKNVWLATNSGLFKFNSKDETIRHYYAEGKNSRNLASNYLNAVATDAQNKIWIAPQYQGIQVFDPLTEEVIQNYSAGRGGISNHIDDIVSDHLNNMWFTSNNGLLQFNRDTRLWKVYNNGEGLSKTNLTGSLTFTQNQKILLGIGSDVVLINPGEMQENNYLPVMHITGFDVSGHQFLEDTLPDFKKNITLAYRQNRVDISVTAIETLYPEKIKIYYRLIGLDTAWQYSDSRHISFVNLAPGYYKFEVKAFNSDGYESKQPAVISFRIKKPFWQTVWFISLCILVIISLLYTFYTFRIRQIFKVQEVKNRISADLHDDIGSRLTNIQLLALISKKQSHLDPTALKNLDNIQEEVTASSEALHDIVTNMRIKGEEPGELAVLLRRYAVQVFELSKTELTLSIDDTISAVKLSADKRSDLFHIYKELLNNVRKHAAAKKVQVVVQKEKQYVLMSIADDGNGFDTSAATLRNGIKILSERIEKWKGTLTIHSSEGAGTSVQIILPV